MVFVILLWLVLLTALNHVFRGVGLSKLQLALIQTPLLWLRAWRLQDGRLGVLLCKVSFVQWNPTRLCKHSNHQSSDLLILTLATSTPCVQRQSLLPRFLNYLCKHTIQNLTEYVSRNTQICCQTSSTADFINTIFSLKPTCLV